MTVTVVFRQSLSKKYKTRSETVNSISTVNLDLKVCTGGERKRGKAENCLTKHSVGEFSGFFEGCPNSCEANRDII